jgi:hypothetical protein
VVILGVVGSDGKRLAEKKERQTGDEKTCNQSNGDTHVAGIRLCEKNGRLRTVAQVQSLLTAPERPCRHLMGGNVFVWDKIWGRKLLQHCQLVPDKS